MVCLDLLQDHSGVINKAYQMLEKLQKPLQLNQESLEIGVSIGVALYPEQATQVPELLRIADEAMYTANINPAIRCIAPTKISTITPVSELMHKGRSNGIRIWLLRFLS